MANPKTTAPTPDQVDAKRKALEAVSAEVQKLQEQIPILTASVKAATEQLEQANLDEVVAARTAGVEDDVAASSAVKAARAALDLAVEARDAAEQRLELMQRAASRLGKEYGELSGALHLARMEAAKAALGARLGAKRDAVCELLAELVTMRTLNDQTTWPQEIDRALEAVLGCDFPSIIRDGHGRADRIRAGATVEEVCP